MNWRGLRRLEKQLDKLVRRRESERLIRVTIDWDAAAQPDDGGPDLRIEQDGPVTRYRLKLRWPEADNGAVGGAADDA